MQQQENTRSKGAFIISIDYEFALGFADHQLTERERVCIRGEVDITKRLLKLFEEYHVPATWAVVGHLLERHCEWEDGLAHPEYERPIHKEEKRDWFFHHPKEGDYSNILWFDSQDLISCIKNATVEHEIASHSYAHIMYDTAGADERAVSTDLENIKRVHTEAGLPVTSFVFPRNREGQHTLLGKYGFTVYRGELQHWYSIYPNVLKRAFHLLDYFLPRNRTVQVEEGESGLRNIPGSFLLLGRGGLRKCIPSFVMKWQLKRGLEKAVSRGEVFHLWFHPSNFWHASETQFRIFESVLKEAARLRDVGELHIVTMRDATRELQ